MHQFAPHGENRLILLPVAGLGDDVAGDRDPALVSVRDAIEIPRPGREPARISVASGQEALCPDLLA